MRSLAFTLSLLCLSATSIAQGVFANKTSSTLEKVIQDFPNRFRNIKGELIHEGNETAQFRSTVQLPGSSSGVVTRYTGTKTEAFTWSCVVFEGESFEQAKKQFRETFDQIKNMIVKIEGEKPFILHGQFQDPTEDKKFTTIILELLPAVGPAKKMKVDLSLQYIITGWKITLSVYDRDRNDSEPGAITGT